MSTENLLLPAPHLTEGGGEDEGDDTHDSPLVASEPGDEGDSTMFGNKKSKSRILLVKIKKMQGMTVCQIASLGIAVVFLVFSIAMLLGCYHRMIYAFLRPHLVISEGSDAYKIWKTTPIPLLLKLYLFNLTNVEEFKQGYDPIVEECGPYVWRELHEKQNVTFHPNSTVTYYQQRWWVWDQEESGSNKRHDVITTINIIPVTVAWTLRNHTLKQFALDLILDDLEEELIIKTTVSKILFDGVEDPLLDWVKTEVIPEKGRYHFLMPYITGAGGLTQYDKFAWFYKRNLSLEYDGLYNMKTGADDLSKLGAIDWWNRERGTPFYKPPCNSVTGSAGELFPINLGKDKVVFYSSDLCMSVSLYYKEEVTGVDDITGYRFWATNHTFANSTVVPGNECYCVNGTCAPTGLLNAESCRMGAPAYISFPHFYNADPFLVDAVSGMHPNETKHAFILDIIPELGAPMNVNPRIQINIKLRPEKNFRILKDLPDLYFPMLWFEIIAAITPELASRAKTVTYLLRSPVTTVVIWAVLIVAALITIILVITVHCRRKDEESRE